MVSIKSMDRKHRRVMRVGTLFRTFDESWRAALEARHRKPEPSREELRSLVEACQAHALTYGAALQSLLRALRREKDLKGVAIYEESLRTFWDYLSMLLESYTPNPCPEEAGFPIYPSYRLT